MRKIITFLGLSACPTRYRLGEEVREGHVFPEAMLRFQALAFDRMLVFVTPGAEERTWPILDAHQDRRIVPVLIGLGAGEQALWDLFAKLTTVVEPGDTVIFDITHSLRFIPFVVFLAAAYLRAAREVELEAIYYAALEMGDAERNVPAPVIDLSPLVSLLDWLTATSEFVHTGDARELAERLEQEGKQADNRALRDLAATVVCAWNNPRYGRISTH